MFYKWESDKFYQFLDMYDDVRNLKPRFVAKTKDADSADAPVIPGSTVPPPPGTTAAPQDPATLLTLSRLFRVAGYDPYSDTFVNLIESDPTVDSL